MITYTDNGGGRPFLILHGGAGPVSVAGFGAKLAAERPARVIVPTHPGFDGTPRQPGLTGIRDLAGAYVDLLEQLDLEDVTVVGNSIGGWIAAEIALLKSPRVSGVVIVNGVGISVPGHPVADFFSLRLDQLAELSYHEPARFRIDPAALGAQRKAVMLGNREALEMYAGQDMTDPTLRERLGAVTVPVLVVWGLSDRLVDPGYGRAYAAAIPTATWHPLEASGHLPQLETPERMMVVWDPIPLVVPSSPIS
ncbi:alpha/beta fold hydrolase [Actinoplanes sp. NPDC051494]|uniref:alpha/beta fold hydrolase n=1 Tax=Actinoplanes sp. NPDC051494 TaxID=3363907 RepID=UPI00379E0A30